MSNASLSRSATRAGLTLAAGALCLLLPLGAQAQWTRCPSGNCNSTAIQVDHFEPAAAQGVNLLNVTTSKLLPHLSPSFGFFIHVAKDPLVLVKEGNEDVVQERVIDLSLKGEFWAGLGIIDWLNVNLVMPVIFHQEGDSDPGAFGQAAEKFVTGADAGDMRFNVKLQILNWQRYSGFGLGLVLGAYFPTGSTTNFNSDGYVRFEPRLVIDYRHSVGFSLVFNLAYQVRPERKTQNIVSDDVLRWAVGLEIPIVDELRILASVYGNVLFTKDRDPYEPSQELAGNMGSPIDAVAGLAFNLPEDLKLGVGGGLGLNRAVGSPEFRVYLTFGYAPDASDIDQDGLRDSIDQCPEKPEDMDSFHDTDGCPEADNDGDGVMDTDDRCPGVDADEGSLDKVREDRDGFEDEDGCPEDDNDKDGLKDEVDRCPNEPEDFDKFEDDDGCPDQDNDGDGIKDADDKCPGVDLDKENLDKVKEDFDKWQDEDGCPEPDNDFDGFLDPVDKCPNEKETKNGYKDDDGCPDVKPKPKRKKVRFKKNKIEILEKVHFETGKAVILPKSFGLLQEVAAVLKEWPQITKLRVEGHTDSKGNARYNLKLSRARAKAVKDFLITDAEVPAERLESEGYGEAKPIASNRSRKGRAKNRRVEFTILEVNGKPVDPNKPIILEKAINE